MHLWGGTTFELLNVLAWVGGGAGFTIGIAYLRDVINRQAFQFERLLDREKQRSEVLLFNILPENIASRLKAKEEPLVDAHECVSILFADLSGFTEISRKLSGDELVNLLIDFFSRFDKLVKEHSAEKIKTIGDAYMVATGLSGSVADHAEKAADLALSMQEAFDVFHIYNKVDLKILIGVHSGAVVAAGIGRKQFS
jgi:adenylate cyclase